MQETTPYVDPAQDIIAAYSCDGLHEWHTAIRENDRARVNWLLMHNIKGGGEVIYELCTRGDITALNDALELLGRERLLQIMGEERAAVDYAYAAAELDSAKTIKWLHALGAEGFGEAFCTAVRRHATHMALMLWRNVPDLPYARAIEIAMCCGDHPINRNLSLWVMQKYDLATLHQCYAAAVRPVVESGCVEGLQFLLSSMYVDDAPDNGVTPELIEWAAANSSAEIHALLVRHRRA